MNDQAIKLVIHSLNKKIITEKLKYMIRIENSDEVPDIPEEKRE